MNSGFHQNDKKRLFAKSSMNHGGDTEAILYLDQEVTMHLTRRFA